MKQKSNKEYSSRPRQKNRLKKCSQKVIQLNDHMNYIKKTGFIKDTRPSYRIDK